MANMCVDKTGYQNAETIRYNAVKTAANYKYAVAAAQIVLNADAAISNFKKLNDIASDALAVEEEQQAHLSGTYWPYEDQMLAEFTQPTNWDTQQALAKRYAGRIWPPIAAGFAKQMKALECQKPRYCGSAFSRKVQELNTQRAATRANVTLWADRIAFYEIQAVKETDWKRRQQVIAMRQGLMSQAASLISQAQAGFAGAQGKAMGAINNAIELIGYTSTRQQGMGTDPAFNMRTMQTAQMYQMGPQQNFGEGLGPEFARYEQVGPQQFVPSLDASFNSYEQVGPQPMGNLGLGPEFSAYEVPLNGGVENMEMF